MLQHLPLVARNVLRNRRRSVLTTASVAVSLCLLGVLMSMYQGLFHAEDASPGQALRVITRHRVSLTQSLPVSYRQRIEQVPGVRAVTDWQWFGGTYKEPQNFFARFGIDPRTLFDVFPDLVIDPAQRQAFQQQRTSCIAGRALAERFNWKPGERIVLVGDIFPVTLDLTLVGTFTDPDDGQSLFFNYDVVREGLSPGDTRRDQVGCYMLAVESTDLVPQVSKQIDAMFDNSPAPTRTESEKQFAMQFVAFLGNLKLFLAAVCGAVVFTVLLVSSNTVAMAVRERVRENAILRTLGFTPGEIMGFILSEAALLGLIGGVLGGLLATGLTVGMTAAARGAGFFFEMPVPGLTVWMILLGVALLVGLFSALVPAWFASRRGIIEAIRYAG